MKKEQEQFMKVYDEYSAGVYRYCYFRLNSREDAEDLTSTVFHKTWDYLAQGKKIDNMRAFLYRVAHNQIVDLYKKNPSKFCQL